MVKSTCAACQFSRANKVICSVMKASDRKALSRRSCSLSLGKGEILSSERLSDWPVLAICGGAMAVQTWLSDGRRSLSQLFLQADLIELRRSPRPFTGELFALRPTHLCALHGRTLDEIRWTDRSVSQAYDAQIADQTHILRDHCVNIGKKTPAERLASFLLELSGRAVDAADELDGKGGKLDLPMSHAEIADYLALQPETVSRVFARIADEHLITRPARNTTSILDAPELARIAGGGRPRRRVVGGAE
ncbi:Crp/Fnr family transcriptional regulator [Algihabitans albus]|uniref:Crp/Fnr family transcriptional regulator n=1 Tax=Algihabitans albus TaxID=2164067 RepID=UPI000E5D38BB|nr:Crp/Fnr family transcriptional regulator [Algihabitans albus]